MPKIHLSDKAIQKKEKIQPAVRKNISHKYRMRLISALNGIQSDGFKVHNNNITLITTNKTLTALKAQVNSKYDFKSAIFHLNYKRHQLGNSNQG